MSVDNQQMPYKCITCKHGLELKSKQSNVIVCSFCASINYGSSFVEPWKNVSGTPLQLLSLLAIGSNIKCKQISGKIIGYIEWQLINGTVILWNLIDGQNNVHYISECRGSFFLYEKVAKEFVENFVFDNIKSGKVITLLEEKEYHNYMVSHKAKNKRYDIFGEVYFPLNTEPLCNHILAYDENGNSLLVLQFNKTQNQIWKGKALNIAINDIENPKFKLVG